MKSYKELNSFYPDGHGTGVGHKRSQKNVFLGERCWTDNDGGWYVKLEYGSWQHFKSVNSTALEMINSWSGGPLRIDSKDIKKFMKNGAPRVNGAIPVPTTTAVCVEFQGKRFINTWRDTRLPTYPEALADPAARPPMTLLLRVLRECLCGMKDELSLDAMLAAARGDREEELEFRFMMSFLAEAMQNPGINLQVNMWLLGRVGRIGKGLLTARILPRLIGSTYVHTVDAEDVEKRGWNDFLEGAIWVVVNELNTKQGKGYFWNNLIKRCSCDATVQITKRNTHSREVLNFANWIVTSNDENPQCLDTHDARNVLIAGTTEEEGEDKQKLAKEFYDYMDANEGPVLDRLLGGFMHILLTHPVDKSLIARAPATLIKEDAIEASGGDSNGEYWLRNGRYQRDVWLKAGDYFRDYIRVTPSAEKMDLRVFGGILAGLARHGLIERIKKPKINSTKPGSNSAKYRISSKRYPGDDPESGTAAPFEVYEGGKAG